MNHVTFFGFEFDLNPVAFSIPFLNDWNVYWYGILIGLGFLLAFLYGLYRAKTLSIDTDKLLDAVIITVPIAIICARAYYLLFNNPSSFFEDFIKIHEGGLAIYGGIIGGIGGAALACYLRKLNFLDAIDLTAPGFFIGQAIGRWGNFFNQEAFGTNTNLPWGMFSYGESGTYEHILSMNNPDLDATLPVHPCFLYESIWCIIGFLILNYMITRRKFKGQLILTYGMWYGLGRTFIEGLRTDSLMLGSVRVSQLLSILIVVVCLIVYIVIIKKKKEETEEYVPVFDEKEDVFFSLSDIYEEGTEDENIEDSLES